MALEIVPPFPQTPFSQSQQFLTAQLFHIVSQSFLGKMTYGIAALFMVTSIWLSVLQGSSGETGLTERLEQATESENADKKVPETSPQK